MLSYSFGQLLYEMAMCRPLNAGMMETAPPQMAAVIRKWMPHIVQSYIVLQPSGPVIETLLTKEAIKKGLPTVDDLIATE